jgi:hypothetical protein
MGKQVFIPLTDDILYDHPELISGPVLPYTTGKPCYHWLSVELNPTDDDPFRASQNTALGARNRIAQYRQWLATLRLPSLQSLAR